MSATVPPDIATRAAPDSRRAVGALGEQLAAEHLERLGCAVLARNARTRYGEIDLIALDERMDALVFAEVKTRRSRARRRLVGEEHPLLSLRPRQRARLRRLAAAWLQSDPPHRPTARTIRFDAIGIVVDECGRLVSLDHLEDAW